MLSGLCDKRFYQVRGEKSLGFESLLAIPHNGLCFHFSLSWLTTLLWLIFLDRGFAGLGRNIRRKINRDDKTLGAHIVRLQQASLNRHIQPLLCGFATHSTFAVITTVLVNDGDHWFVHWQLRAWNSDSANHYLDSLRVRVVVNGSWICVPVLLARTTGGAWMAVCFQSSSTNTRIGNQRVGTGFK